MSESFRLAVGVDHFLLTFFAISCRSAIGIENTESFVTVWPTIFSNTDKMHF
jgi:hypothetical protein